MKKRRINRPAQDPLEAAIEAALCPGELIGDHASWPFVTGLEEPARCIEELVEADPARAVRLYEVFLAGCYEKAEEIDDSSANFGQFVGSLYTRWIRSRQAMAADPDETAIWLLARMDDDPYGFVDRLERHVAQAMNKANRAAFARHIRERFDALHAAPNDEGDGREYARRRWSDVLRAVHAAQKDAAALIALCEETGTTAQDCLVIATLYRARKRDEALVWIDRGLDLEMKDPHGSMARYDLARLKREVLVKLGRAAEALDQAWGEFRVRPGKYTYEDLMRLVPKAERPNWHAKAMDAAAGADLASLIALLLQTKDIGRLVERLTRATPEEIERLSHYTTEPAAKRLARLHPAVAGKIYCAMGMRIVNAGKSKYYRAALSNFEQTKICYERAGLDARWQAVVCEVRQRHRRKVGFIGGFERLVGGQAPSEEPSFLERAKRRWSSRGAS